MKRKKVRLTNPKKIKKQAEEFVSELLTDLQKEQKEFDREFKRTQENIERGPWRTSGEIV